MDPATLDAIFRKVGGKFKAVTLFQKRMRELMNNAPPLVEVKDNMTLDQIVTAEILQDKITLTVGDAAESVHLEREKLHVLPPVNPTEAATQ
ncbi:MAG TPA: DNA-directed RNA polymerase subunit omega [Planctomycetota bacterium]|nr:DNA-directed RNA polymerase subunit omega [Planctomycetota bacterium]